MRWLQDFCVLAAGGRGPAWVPKLVLGGSHWVQWLLFPGFTEACFLLKHWSWLHCGLAGLFCAPRMQVRILKEDRMRREKTSAFSPFWPMVGMLKCEGPCIRNGAVVPDSLHWEKVGTSSFNALYVCLRYVFWGSFIFTYQETEAQRCSGTCSRLPSQDMAGPGGKPMSA